VSENLLLPLPLLLPIPLLIPDLSHEHVSSLMATPARSFIDTYNNEITELKRHFMGYVKALCASGIASRSAAQGDSTQI
jgi:hypothetical protein